MEQANDLVDDVLVNFENSSMHQIPYLPEVKRFLILAGMQLVILIVYYISFHSGHGEEHFLPYWISEFTPYITNDREGISPYIKDLISLYYLSAIILMFIYIFVSFLKRTRPVYFLHLIYMIAALGLFSLPWLLGWEMRRIDLGNLHRGVILDHILAMFPILFVAGVGCFGAFIRRPDQN